VCDRSPRIPLPNYKHLVLIRGGFGRESASRAVCGSGTLPYEFKDLYGAVYIRFYIRNG
jgi:hypothetical protein